MSSSGQSSGRRSARRPLLELVPCAVVATGPSGRRGPAGRLLTVHIASEPTPVRLGQLAGLAMLLRQPHGADGMALVGHRMVPWLLAGLPGASLLRKTELRRLQRRPVLRRQLGHQPLPCSPHAACTRRVGDRCRSQMLGERDGVAGRIGQLGETELTLTRAHPPRHHLPHQHPLPRPATRPRASPRRPRMPPNRGSQSRPPRGRAAAPGGSRAPSPRRCRRGRTGRAGRGRRAWGS